MVDFFKTKTEIGRLKCYNILTGGDFLLRHT